METLEERVSNLENCIIKILEFMERVELIMKRMNITIAQPPRLLGIDSMEKVIRDYEELVKKLKETK